MTTTTVLTADRSTFTRQPHNVSIRAHATVWMAQIMGIALVDQTVAMVSFKAPSVAMITTPMVVMAVAPCAALNNRLSIS